MFHPVGNQPPSVYWRRRLLLFASLALVIVLIALTVRAMSSNAAGKPQGSGQQPAASGAPVATRHATESSAASSSRPASRETTHSRHEHATESKHSSSVANSAPAASTSASTSTSSSAPPPRCQPKNLDIRAVVARSSYKVGQQPEVELQVTNVGAQPCVQDLADKQIVLKIYNGESRVWGSHDCQIEPGTDDQVLAVGSPVRVSITWSGLTSRPNCAGTRQRVGAGTYTLYASLSGHTGKAAQFSIT